MKYQTKHCTGFWLPDDPTARQVDLMPVKIALGSWDEVEDHEDQSIFFYMDGEPLEEGLIVSDGFVITSIDEDLIDKKFFNQITNDLLEKQ